MMTTNLKVKLAATTCVIFWGSAFVGIRAGLQYFSPEGLALWRFIIASVCMFFIYRQLPKRSDISNRHKAMILATGALGIGVYSLALNCAELTVQAAMACFFISQLPVLSMLLAVVFLNERLTRLRLLGFFISFVGVCIIAMAQGMAFKFDSGLICIFIAILCGSLYTILQKSFLHHYEAIETNAWLIWGGTLFLTIFFPSTVHEVMQAPLPGLLIVIYLGIFPAAIGYLGWSYILKQIPASQAVSYLYFQPMVAMVLGWVWLSEMPTVLAVVGGIIAVMGSFVISQSQRRLLKKAQLQPQAQAL